MVNRKGSDPMQRRVGIVAAAQTKYKASRSELSILELVWEVVEKILKQTGLKFEHQERRGEELFIDKIINCSEDFWQGRTISDQFTHLEMGGLGMDVTKVAGDGAFGIFHGAANILSGKHDVVLVVAWRKESEASRSVIENAGLDPIYLRPLGLDFLITSAMQANRYMHQYHISEEQCAEVVVKNRRNAFQNPYAQEPLNLSVTDVLNSKMLSYPIRELDCKPVSDGACAIILASEGKARKLTSKPVWIAGLGCCYDAHYPGDRDLSECNSLQTAARTAYRMAGIKNPFSEIDVLEVSEEYSYQELLWMEGLGLCGRGEAGELVQSGVTQREGKLPINPSGGVLSGNPSGVSGMIRVAEAYAQLSDQAGEREIPGVKVALAHGCYGVDGQLQCVVILKRNGGN